MTDTSMDPSVTTHVAPTGDMEEDTDGPAIRRQVEFYFSDENLPHDAYLLGLCGGKENLPISINRISGFGKMRRFKPKSRIREALRRSTFLVMPDDKHVQRRHALTIEPRVEPARSYEQEHASTIADKPWMTKALLKPTGFEPSFADAPLTPQAAEAERVAYHLSVSFASRIQTAIQRYRARRKLHQLNASILSTFLAYGGIETGPRQFTGGLGQQDLEDRSAEDIAALTAIDFVPDYVRDETKWVVDFAGITRGFLSSHRIYEFGLGAPEDIKTVTNVMSNLYRYLQYHDVCPEHSAALRTANDICHVANTEVVAARTFSAQMPDGFNSACSVLFGGQYALIYAADQSWSDAPSLGWTLQQAETTFLAFIAACGSEAQFAAVKGLLDNKTADAEGRLGLNRLRADKIVQVALQICEICELDEKAGAVYASAALKDSFGTPVQSIICRRLNWDLTPRQSPVSVTAPDTEPASAGADSTFDADDLVTLYLQQSTLENAFEGMKLEVEIHTLSSLENFSWIDSVRSVNASFHEILPNENFDRKAIGLLPTEYPARLRKLYEYGWKTQEDLLEEARLAESGEADGPTAEEDEEEHRADSARPDRG